MQNQLQTVKIHQGKRFNMLFRRNTMYISQIPWQEKNETDQKCTSINIKPAR